MIEAALYHGFSEDSDNEDGVTDYRCSRAVLLKLMRACVKQGETNAKVKELAAGYNADLLTRDNVVLNDKLDRLLEQTKPKTFEIEVGPSLPPPSALGMGYGASAALIKKDLRIAELQKELYRVLDDKRKMYEPPTDSELLICCEIFGPIRSVQTGPELQIAVRKVLNEIIAMRKASTTYDNRPKPTPEKIAEPTVTEINNIREAVAESFNYNPDSKNMTKLLTEAITRFVELRNKD